MSSIQNNSRQVTARRDRERSHCCSNHLTCDGGGSKLLLVQSDVATVYAGDGGGDGERSGERGRDPFAAGAPGLRGSCERYLGRFYENGAARGSLCGG